MGCCHVEAFHNFILCVLGMSVLPIFCIYKIFESVWSTSTSFCKNLYYFACVVKIFPSPDNCLFFLIDKYLLSFVQKSYVLRFETFVVINSQEKAIKKPVNQNVCTEIIWPNGAHMCARSNLLLSARLTKVNRLFLWKNFCQSAKSSVNFFQRRHGPMIAVHTSWLF
jgi:hypothetical protein